MVWNFLSKANLKTQMMTFVPRKGLLALNCFVSEANSTLDKVKTAQALTHNLSLRWLVERVKRGGQGESQEIESEN